MELKLNKSTNEILTLITELTNKPFEFIHKQDLQTFASVKIARQSMESHIIFYKIAKGGILDHLIAHECGHIFRMYSVPLEDRKVPASNEDNKRFALKQIGEDLIKLSKTIPVDNLGQLSNLWFDGLIRQVTNFPVDMRIEKWIYDNYPELRKSQKISLDSQMREATHVLSKNISLMTPKKIYDANNCMNYAFAYFLESLIGKKYSAPYRNTPYKELGSELVDIVMKSEDQGFNQDIEIINQWTEMLGLKGWYYWSDFEDLPPNYLQYQ